MSNPFVTIIIPAKNAQSTIKKCLDSVCAVDYSPYEVIVINDGSGDDTALMLNAYPQVKVINTTGVGPAKSRNIAVGQARGDLIAFTDADCRVDKDWIKELVSGFTRGEIASVGGSQRPAADESDFGRQVFRFMVKCGLLSDYGRSCAGAVVEVSHNPSCNSMYRKEAFIRSDGFPEDLWPGEDVELDFRVSKMGLRIVFNPRAIVYHYRVKDRGSFLKMMVRYGWAQAVLVRRHGFFRRIQFAPLAGLLFLSAWLCCLLFNPLLSAAIAFSAAALAWGWFCFDFVLAALAVQGILAWNWGYLMGITGKRCLKA